MGVWYVKSCSRACAWPLTSLVFFTTGDNFFLHPGARGEGMRAPVRLKPRSLLLSTFLVSVSAHHSLITSSSSRINRSSFPLFHRAADCTVGMIAVRTMRRKGKAKRRRGAQTRKARSTYSGFQSPESNNSFREHGKLTKIDPPKITTNSSISPTLEAICSCTA